MLSLSSLGVVAKVLIDAGRLKEPVGVQIFTAVIIAELIALFVVGFAISEHFYAGGHGHSLNPLDVAVLVGQIVGFTVATWFFVPLFFASAGLHLSLEFLKLPPETILALVLVPLAGKFAGAFISAFITRLDAPLATAAGLMAKGVAEIALLLLLLHTGAIDKGVFSLLVLVMFGYILLTPMGITFALRRLKHAEAVTSDDQTPPLLDRFALEGIRVKDILDRSRSHPEQSLTVRAFAERWLLPEQHDYVVVEHGKLVGIVSLSMLRYLPRSEWEHTPLSRVVRQDGLFAYPDELVEDALQRMTESSLTVLPVADSETREFIGSITSHEVLEMIVLAAKGH